MRVLRRERAGIEQRFRDHLAGAFAALARRQPQLAESAYASQSDGLSLVSEDDLDVQLLGRGFAWLDTGTMESLVEAADFVHMIEKRQGIKISAPEEIAFKYGWIDRDTLLESAQRYGKSPYGQHLKNVAEGKLRY